MSSPPLRARRRRPARRRSVARVPLVALVALGAALPWLAGPLGAQPRDRPVGIRGTITGGPLVAAPGTLVVAAGASRDPGRTWHAGEVTLHVPLPGLAGRTGLRVGFPGYAWRDAPAAHAAGLEDATVGVAARAVRGTPAHPGLVAVVGTRLPTGSRPGVPRLWAPSVRLVSDWAPAPGTTVWANLTVAAVPSGAPGAAAPATTAQTTASLWAHRAVVGPLGVYAEGWTSNARGTAGGHRAGAHGGVTWLLTHDLRLDAHWGRTLHGARGTLAGLGVIVRH